MSMEVKRIFNRYMKKHTDNWTKFKCTCQVCSEEITEDSDFTGIEYVKTKRGTEIFVHRDCARAWGRE
jgi:ATP-dependent DNA ligase